MEKRTVGVAVNTKSLFAQTTAIIEKVISGEIKESTASIAFKGVNCAVGILNYELKRTAIEMALQKCGGRVAHERPRLREIESLAFDECEELFD